MIFADNRYSRSDKRKKLPQWLSNYLKTEYINLSTDVAVDIAGKFVKKMAQPHSRKDEIGKSLLGLDDIKKLKADIRNEYGGDDHDAHAFEQSQFAALNQSLSKVQMERNQNSNNKRRGGSETMDID